MARELNKNVDMCANKGSSAVAALHLTEIG